MKEVGKMNEICHILCLIGLKLQFVKRQGLLMYMFIVARQQALRPGSRTGNREQDSNILLLRSRGSCAMR